MMKKRLSSLLSASVLCASSVLLSANSGAQSQAATVASTDAPPGLVLSDTQEARVKSLSAELRCVVCQNQTVADSTSMVARDMREQVRQQIAAGKTDSEVKQYLTDRFGEFVLYKPPLKATTIALWFGPFFVLLIAAAILIRRLQKPAVAATALSEAEQQRARKLLDGDVQ